MKKTFSKILMIAAMAFIACSSDDDAAPTPGHLDMTPATFAFTAEGGTGTFTVNGGSAFARSNADWISIERTSADKNGSTFEIECAANTQSADREGKIMVNLAGTYNYVTVTQVGMPVEEDTQYTFRSAREVSKDMYPGWNLGNTLEACDYNNLFNNAAGLGSETSWQSTQTSQAVIDAVEAAGFKSVRIPVAWLAGHVSGGSEADPTIDAAWLARVKQIVDYCINDGLYVVLNDHWDGGWIEMLGFSSDRSSYSAIAEDQITARITTLQSLWTVIANYFRNYDEHLIFAGLNEPFQEYNLFSSRHQVLTPILERYNKAFVEAVRATGGNNASRILVVQGPSVNIASSCQYMPASHLPEAAGKLMVEVHYYDPGQFCGTFDSTGSGAYYYWGSANHGANHNPTYGEETYMESQFNNLQSTYTSQGYPVIIGEYAALQRTLTAEGTDQAKHDASVKYYYQTLNQYAVNRGIVPFAWDTNDVAGLGKESGSSTIINRSSSTVAGTNAMEGIKAGCAAAQWPY